MYVTLISPITEHIPLQFQKLSFYGRQDLAPGSIVPIVFNNRPMHGIVLGSAPLQNLKQSIKSSPFTMKKLDLTPETIIPPSHQSEFILKIADITLQNPGKLYFNFFGEKYPSTSQDLETLPKTEIRNPHVLACELNRFALVEKIKITKPGIIICASSGMCELWRTLTDVTHVITPVQLPLFLIEHGQDFPTLSVAIIDVSDNRYTQSQRAPYLDYREIIIPALQYLGTGQIKLDLYDTYIDTMVLSIFQLSPQQIMRSTQLITPLAIEHTRDTRYLHTMFTRESFEHIKNTVNSVGIVHIITGRKGIAGSVSCSNCAYIARCPECHHVQSLVSRRKSGERLFHCHQCQTKSPVYDHCPECQGLLTPLGYTTISIAETLKNLGAFQDIPIIIIDSDTTKNVKKLTKQYSQVKNGGIVVTTPGFETYMDTPHLCLIVSLEGLLLGSAYNQDSIVYRYLRSVSSPCIIQSRSIPIDEKLIADTTTYATDEKSIFTTYGLPPYMTHITLTKIIKSDDMSGESIFIHSLIKQFTDLTHRETRAIPSKNRTVTVSHTLSYPPVYHTEFIKNILPMLIGYSIRKK